MDWLIALFWVSYGFSIICNIANIFMGYEGGRNYSERTTQWWGRLITTPIPILPFLLNYFNWCWTGQHDIKKFNYWKQSQEERYAYDRLGIWAVCKKCGKKFYTEDKLLEMHKQKLLTKKRHLAKLDKERQQEENIKAILSEEIIQHKAMEELEKELEKC